MGVFFTTDREPGSARTDKRRPSNYRVVFLAECLSSDGYTLVQPGVLRALIVPLLAPVRNATRPRDAQILAGRHTKSCAGADRPH
jgi:hypothetical protein